MMVHIKSMREGNDMASIIPNEEKLKALDTVNRLLNEIRQINEAINDGGTYRLSFPARKKYLDIDQAQADRILAALKKMKETRTREIERTAARYGIELDDSDREVLSPAAG